MQANAGSHNSPQTVGSIDSERKITGRLTPVPCRTDSYKDLRTVFTPTGGSMISGIHAIIYSKQAERLREFFRDILQLPSVDAGHGWLIFAAPPAELAMHPDEDSYHELYLMCDDVQSTTEILKTKGVTLTTPISDRGWGLITRLKLPSGDEI